MSNSITRALQVAEEIVDRYGDPKSFAREFANLRQTRGIMESLEIALRKQDLWDIFLARG